MTAPTLIGETIPELLRSVGLARCEKCNALEYISRMRRRKGLSCCRKCCRGSVKPKPARPAVEPALCRDCGSVQVVVNPSWRGVPTVVCSGCDLWRDATPTEARRRFVGVIHRKAVRV